MHIYKHRFLYNLAMPNVKITENLKNEQHENTAVISRDISQSVHDYFSRMIKDSRREKKVNFRRIYLKNKQTNSVLLSVS